MLREILIVKQDNPALRRRWFESDYFDLFIWQDLAGSFKRFQLCYDVERNERALIWGQDEGFFHDGVDHGDGGYGRGGHGQTPIFVPDGKFDSGTVVPRFTREAAQIPVDVRDFVLVKIREHLIELHQARKRRKQVRRDSWQRRKSDTFPPAEN